MLVFEIIEFIIWCLSNTYTSIALDTRLLAQPYCPSQIELSSPAIRNSFRGLIRGPIFSCPALPRSWSCPGEKTENICKTNVKIKWTYSCIFLLIPAKIALKTLLKTLKYPFSYTEYLHTKWRQRQTFERHYVTTTSKKHATFSWTKVSAKGSVKATLSSHVMPCKPSSAF